MFIVGRLIPCPKRTCLYFPSSLPLKIEGMYSRQCFFALSFSILVIFFFYFFFGGGGVGGWNKCSTSCYFCQCMNAVGFLYMFPLRMCFFVLFSSAGFFFPDHGFNALVVGSLFLLRVVAFSFLCPFPFQFHSTLRWRNFYHASCGNVLRYLSVYFLSYFIE